MTKNLICGVLCIKLIALFGKTVSYDFGGFKSVFRKPFIKAVGKKSVKLKAEQTPLGARAPAA